jgi:lysophospholipase L1-like esterase
VATVIPSALPTAIVSLGDSFISGEAGRWLGNSDTYTGSRDGTDRAYDPDTGDYDPEKIDGSSYDDGCDRSDVSEIHSAAALVKVDQYINLACSGATTDAIWNSFKGEPPQEKQLAAVASSSQVQAIVLSIGGNDLDVSGMLESCGEDFIYGLGHCNEDSDMQKRLEKNLPDMSANVARALDHIRGVMQADHYADDSYRIILQSYPSTLPDSKHIRYQDESEERYKKGGCPFYNDDLDWIRDSMTGQISDALDKVAASTKVNLLDLRDALSGREVCATTTNLVDDEHPVSPVTSEWGRFVAGHDQGTSQESLHPNAIAQPALGYCLGLFLNAKATAERCLNTPGKDYRGMYLTP